MTDTNINTNFKREGANVEGGPQEHDNGDSSKVAEGQTRRSEQLRQLSIPISRCDSEGSTSSDRSVRSQGSRRRSPREIRTIRDIAHESKRVARRALYNTKRGIPGMEMEGETDVETEVDTVSMTSEGEDTSERPGIPDVLNAREFPALCDTMHATRKQITAGSEGATEKQIPFPILKQERRGRKETTGAYRIKKQKEAKKKEEEEALREQEILDPQYEPSQGKSYSGWLNDIKEKGEEFRKRPTQDLEALAAEKARAIFKIAVYSSSLKGNYVKYAKEAAGEMCAAATTLAMRAINPREIPMEKQLEDLRMQIHQLQMEKQQLEHKLEHACKRKQRKPRPSSSEDESEEPLRNHARRRTRNWAGETPLPPVDGGVPLTQGPKETPLPPLSGEVSPGERREMRGAPLPPFGGEAPNKSRIGEKGKAPGVERMEVDEDWPSCSNEGHVSSMTRGGEDPPQGSNGRMYVKKGEKEYVVPQHGDKEEGEKEKHLALIAMIEGVITRELDRRLGCPPPINKIPLKARDGVQQQNAQKQQQQHKPQSLPKKRAQQTEAEQLTSEPKEAAKPKIVLKKMETLGKKVRVVQQPTTLAPMARKATERIPTTEPQNKGTNKGPASQKKREKEVSQILDKSKETPQEKTEGETWSSVVSRKTKKAMAAQKKKEAEVGKRTAERRTTPSLQSNLNSPTNPVRKRREPRTAAISITCPPGTYEANLREARQRMEERGLHLEGANIRRGVTGSYIFEIPGENRHERADKFALGLKEALQNKKGVKIQRPTKMAEIRLRGLDESIRAPEIVKAIAATGGCFEEEVQLGEIRRSPAGTGIVWARCPLVAANAILKTARIQIGWAVVRVELLEARPLQCFKCLEGGHVRARCPNAIDHSGKCYRCGEEGHAARHCEAAVNCPVCTDKGLPANHRAGSKACTPVQKGRKGVPLQKATDRPSTERAPRQDGKPNTQMEALPLIDLGETGEAPKEQRPPKTRGNKREEEKLPPGASKKQRTQLNLLDTNPDAMEASAERDKKSEDDL